MFGLAPLTAWKAARVLNLVRLLSWGSTVTKYSMQSERHLEPARSSTPLSATPQDGLRLGRAAWRSGLGRWFAPHAAAAATVEHDHDADSRHPDPSSFRANFDLSEVVVKAKIRRMERKPLDDRQLDAILERLDRLCDEVHALNRRFETAEGLIRIAHELSTLNESLQTMAKKRKEKKEERGKEERDEKGR